MMVSLTSKDYLVDVPTFSSLPLSSLFRCWVWLTGYVAIYSIATSLVVHLRASGRNVQTWTILTNIVGLGFPFVFLCISLPVSLLAGHAAGEAIRHHRQIQRVLLEAADEWSPGEGIDLPSLLSSLVPILADIDSNLKRISTLRPLYYITLDVACGIVLLSYIAIGGYYVAVLKRTLHATRVVAGGSLNDGQKRVKRTMNASLNPLCKFASILPRFL